MGWLFLRVGISGGVFITADKGQDRNWSYSST